MTSAARWVLAAAAFCGACVVSGIAMSQENGKADAGVRAPTAAFDEEIVVRGRNREELRSEIRAAEEAFYARFNEVNSDDEFDIQCRWVVEIGSRMRHRRCQPNFWIRLDTEIGEETVRAMQGSFALPLQAFQGEQHYKGRLLVEEIRRLAVEDEELLQALTRLANLQNALKDSRRSRETLAALSARQQAAGERADDDLLPYDAGLMAEVRVGREPWDHALTLRTFTIAQVYGEIRAIEVACHGRRQSLQHEAGVEWTLPESWGDCTLHVDAARDTTFVLYEFE